MMTRHSRLVLALAAATMTVGLGSAPATAGDGFYSQDQSRTDQGDARREMRAGNHRSLREIERRILPQMRGSEYLGPSYDSTARAYRLKFIKDGRVTYIDVDARTGRIINRSN